MFRKVTVIASLLLVAACGGRSAADHIAFAELQFTNGQYAEAIRSYEAALEEAPDRVDLHVRIAEILVARKEYGAARERIEAVLERTPGDLAARTVYTNSLLWEEDYDGAARAARAAVENATDRAGAFDLLARVGKDHHVAILKALLDTTRDMPNVSRPERILLRLERGDLASVTDYLENLAQDDGVERLLELVADARRAWALANEAVTRALEVEPGRVESRILRGELAFLNGRPEEAEADLEPALSKDVEPELRRKALDLLVSIREELGDEAGALKAAEAALLIDPRHRTARLRRALLLIRKGELDSAVEDARALEEQERGSYLAAYIDGIVLTLREKPKEAVPLLTQATRLHRNPGPHLWLGLALRGTGKIELAIESFREAIRLNPNLDVAHLALASASLAKGRARKAVESAEIAVEIRPDSPAARMLFAQALLAWADALGDGSRRERVRARAEEQLVALLDLAPDVEGGVEALALMRLSGGRLDDAALAVIHGLKQDPEDAALLSILGALHARRGDTASARGAFEDAIRLDPDLAGPYTGLAEINRAEGRPREAEEVLRKLLARVPGSVPGCIVLAALLASEDRIAEADKALLEGIRENPDSPRLHFSRLALLRETGREEGLVDSLREACRTAPGDPRGYDLALIMLDRGEEEEAVAVARAATKELPRDPVAWVLLAVSLRTAGEEGAIDAAGRALALAPRDLFVLALALDLHLQGGNPDRAQAHLDAAQYVPPAVRRTMEKLIAKVRAGQEGLPLALAAFDRSIAYHLTGRWDERAALWARRSLEGDRGNVIALEILGFSCARRSDFDAAARAFRDLLEREPDLVNVRVALARLHLTNGDGKSALAELETAWRQGLADPGGVILYARLLSRAGRGDEALAVAEKAVALAPGFLSALLEVGLLYEALGRVEEARLTFEQAIEIDPDSAAAMTHLARLLCAGTGSEERALGLAKKAVSLEPRAPEARHALAVAHLRAGELDPALRAMEKALELAPGNPVYLARRAEILLHLDRPEEAEADLEKSKAKSPDVARVTLNLALLADKSGDLAKAVRHYESVLAIAGDSVPVTNNLAYAYARLGENLERARALAETAVRLSRRNPATLDTLAAVELAEGRAGDALALLTEATKAAPEEPQIRYHRGRALFLLGRNGESAEELEAALESEREFPDRAEAEALLGRARGGR